MYDSQQTLLQEPDEFLFNEPPLMRRRLVVIGLYASFIACLMGVWSTGNLFGTSNQFLTSLFIHYLANYRVAILLIPLIVLLIFYLLLRNLTGEIMAMPERYLDERQKMIRDQAHRYAYRIIKVVCLLVPAYLCLHAIFWTGQAIIPPQTSTVTHMLPFLKPVGSSYITIHAHSLHYGIINGTPKETSTLHNSAQYLYLMAEPQMRVYQTQIVKQPTPTWPHDPQSIALYYGTLLISIFVLVASLPMSIVAWKKS